MERIRVFCSHNSVDKPRVKAVAERLAAAGIDPWVDAWEIAPGDDIVARINEGLADCQVGLIFFSKKTLEKPWVRNEVSTLTYQAIEDGKAVIPVMLDADAPVPELLRPRARVAGEDLDRLIDAIYGRTGKPRLAPVRTEAREQVLRIRLDQLEGEALQVSAALDGEARAFEPSRLDGALRRSYREFLASSLPGLSRAGLREAAARRERDLERLGEALGHALLPGAVGGELAAALDRVAAAGEALRLEVEAVPDLLALPFEAARLPNRGVPALDPGVRFLRRQIGLGVEPVDPLPPPLRILVAVGAPDADSSQNAVLDYERELSTILDAIDRARQYGNAEVKILEVGHPEQIRQALVARPYHVLHLSGHGSAGRLELEDEDGRAVPVSAEELAAALRASGRRAPLIFLASCLSGADDSDTTGFAQGLLAQGVPLVVAMQTSVSDWYATRLAGAFYRELSTSETPLPSRALAQARREVEQERREALARGERHPGLVPEYATPTLFAAAEERPLIDYGLPKEEPAAESAPPPAGRMPLLGMDELIGRRPALRRVTGVLRDDPRVTGALGPRAGVLVSGIGGVGKSALAGRAMARLAEDGWTVCAAVGRFALGELAVTVGAQLALLAGKLAAIGLLLLRAELPDQVRLAQLQALLANHRLLLVLDNFEDNLTLGGGGFLDEGTGFILGALLRAARRGKVLITSRYPLPGFGDWLAQVPLGPLSPAETRKLFYRLPALTGEAPETLGLILRHIGGHPRMLEYLDAILRRGAARLPAVADGLRANARKLGLDPQHLGGDLEESIRDTLRLGAEDVLLDQLLDLVGQEPKDLTTLRQAAAFAVPVDIHGLAFALADGEPTAAQVAAAEASARRLIGTSLLTPMPGELLWVHRWTAQEIRARMDGPGARESSRRAGEYRAWRVVNVSHDLSDGIEATRRFLEAGAFDRAAEMAEPILQFMGNYGQQVDVAAFAGEVLEVLPETDARYYYFCSVEADALRVLGATDRATARYREVQGILERLARAEPARADYQRDLSVSYNKMGDLYQALGQGEAAQAAFQQALDIRERLARAEPARADYQWDLAVSLWRVADFADDGGIAHLERALAILGRLDAAGALYPEQRAWIPRFADRLGRRPQV
jgi:tetratricopeptide (TPR) repeat protein